MSNQAETIKTKIFSYHYNINHPEEKLAYKALTTELKAQGLRCFSAWGGCASFYNAAWEGGLEIELETKQLFADQWNTATLRVFDWAEDYPINFSRSIKRGHYIIQTPRMIEIRETTVCCGYCGKQQPQSTQIWCDKCLDSEYLTEADFPLLRLRKVSEKYNNRNDKRHNRALTPDELAYLKPLYITAQTTGTASRMVAKREAQIAQVKAALHKATRNAQTEHDGKMWFLDRHLSIDNLIYYSHTGTFCLGWHNPISSPDLQAEWREKVKGFPFKLDIQTGKK